MSKTTITIVGGGISGLSALHYLHQRYAERDDIQLQLIEKNQTVGGTIQTQSLNGALFETGPNGFLIPQDASVALAEELGIADKLLRANEQAAQRYILVNNQLCQVPSSPPGILSFKGLSLKAKLRLFLEPLIGRVADEDETIYDFCARRLGKEVAEYIADPVISGVFGGDVRRLAIRSAFPMVFKMEQQYDSLFRAAFTMQRKNKKPRVKRKLTSYQQGMGQLIQALHIKYADNIITGQGVRAISKAEHGYVVDTDKARYESAVVVCTAPAYQAALMTHNLNSTLAQCLNQIPYAPIAVIGLGFRKSDVTSLPNGFGYLVPSAEQKDVLGVLFESNIFDGRTDDDYVMLRVMIGGRRREDLMEKNEQELVSIALDELNERFDISASPVQTMFKKWAKAIPQYERGYHDTKKKMMSQIKRMPGLYLCANYVDGIAFNDCVRLGRDTAERVGEYCESMVVV